MILIDTSLVLQLRVRIAAHDHHTLDELIATDVATLATWRHARAAQHATCNNNNDAGNNGDSATDVTNASPLTNDKCGTVETAEAEPSAAASDNSDSGIPDDSFIIHITGTPCHSYRMYACICNASLIVGVSRRIVNQDRDQYRAVTVYRSSRDSSSSALAAPIATTASSTTSASPHDNIRVASVNIWNYNHWQKRMPVLQNELRRIDAGNDTPL